jgi:hypothetical protein
MDTIRINKYNVVQLSEYNGTWSLVLGWEDKGGNFKPTFCEREFGKGNLKKVPVKIELGDKAKAIEVLSAFIEELGGSVPF